MLADSDGKPSSGFIERVAHELDGQELGDGLVHRS
jgi:hypothetical protein